MSSRWRKRVCVLVVVGLAVAAVVGWYRYPSGVAPPEIPRTGIDPEVSSALSGAREAVLKSPTSAPAWGKLGMIFRAHGFYPQSNACFTQAAALDPENPRWPYLIGLSHLVFAPDDAVPSLRTAVRLAKTQEHQLAVRLRLGEALVERGEIQEAESLFREVLRETPDDPRAHFGLGVLASARGDTAAAYTHLELAATSPFARRKANALLAAVARRGGDADRATRYERAAASGPQDVPWPDPFISEYKQHEAGRSEKWRRATELQEDGRLSEALAVLEELARSAPDTRALLAMGRVLDEMGEYANAAAMFRAVLAENPNHAAACFSLGFVLYKQGADRWEHGNRTEQTRDLFEEAVKELQRSTDLRPDHGTAYLAKAMALRYLGRLPEAEAACREAVLVTPQVANCHLTLGEVLIDRGRPVEAIPHLEEAGRLDPREPRVKLMLEKARTAAKP